MPDRSAILVESQAVQESLPVSDNNIHLVYHSARTKGYLSTIQLQLTPDTVPAALIKVHLKITIEGVVHEKVFEADPNIRYTYSWDRLNEYRQVNILVFFVTFYKQKRKLKFYRHNYILSCLTSQLVLLVIFALIRLQSLSNEHIFFLRLQYYNDFLFLHILL